jgi:uncharacterized protein (DUF111 family)
MHLIVTAVAAGSSWTTAALAAGMDPERFNETIQRAQQSGCQVKLRFVSRLKKAGQKATEASLQQHRSGGMHV